MHNTTPQSDSITATANIALAGNPNTGKTTLFNKLTGAKQRVGNYPGVTVEKKVGQLKINNDTHSLIDLPGTYSLAAESLDEHIVLDVLTGNVPNLQPLDLIVCVVDATNIHRNLYLVSQIADVGIPIVIALNMMDEANQKGLTIDIPKLQKNLNIPVIPITASQNKGIKELKQAIRNALENKPKFNVTPWPQAIIDATQSISDNTIKHLNIHTTPLQQLRLLFDADSTIADRLGYDTTTHHQVIQDAREHLKKAQLCPAVSESSLRYTHINNLIKDTITKNPKPKTPQSDTIDTLLTHRFFGLIIFSAIMATVFYSIYALAGPFMDFIDEKFGAIGQYLGDILKAQGAPVLADLVQNGIIAGLGGIIIFLPQILILFFFIAILEDSGYMARAAFLMDKLFSWCGLNGKSFVPMLSSYACAIPGVMGTRTISEPRARLTTILIAPLMSCSARLPVYIIFTGAVIQPQYGTLVAAVTVFAMHLLGLFIGLPIAFILNKFILKTKAQPFVLEMPPYRIPTLHNLAWRLYEKGKDFVLTAGTVILATSVIIWALLYFPQNDPLSTKITNDFNTQNIAQIQQIKTLNSDKENKQALEKSKKLKTQLDTDLQKLLDDAAPQIASAQTENSYLAKLGKGVEPIFQPAGFDWKITVGILASFPARELIVPTLGIIYAEDIETENGEKNLLSKIAAAKWTTGPNIGKKIFTIPVAVAVMVFFALCAQCMATIAVIARETNWKWATISFTYMTVLAWIGAVLTYQIGTALFY